MKIVNTLGVSQDEYNTFESLRKMCDDREDCYGCPLADFCENCLTDVCMATAMEKVKSLCTVVK